MNNNMTALISAFARLYHTKNNSIKIYDDTYADRLITGEEYETISENMKKGIKFFNPNYCGDNPLDWIVNNNLAPSVLARAIFNENNLQNQINIGVNQYVILASGYDTSAFKFNDKLNVFELDKSEMIEDKIARVSKANLDTTNITYVKTDFCGDWINDLLITNYSKNKKTFCSALGISYYLDKIVFENTINQLSKIIPSGSFVVFDYPNDFETDKEKINQQLAKGANEEMKSKYSIKDIENIAQKSDMYIYKHLHYEDINNTYFYKYNLANQNNKIIAPKGVSYVIMSKY